MNYHQFDYDNEFKEGTKVVCNLDQKPKMIFHKNAHKNVVCILVAMLSLSKWHMKIIKINWTITGLHNDLPPARFDPVMAHSNSIASGKTYLKVYCANFFPFIFFGPVRAKIVHMMPKP